jgi:hypothetical protein
LIRSRRSTCLPITNMIPTIIKASWENTRLALEK